MTYRQDTVFSLILVPIRSGLRGFCLFILEIFLKDYQQKNPLKYYAPALSYLNLGIMYTSDLSDSPRRKGIKNKFFHNISCTTQTCYLLS